MYVTLVSKRCMHRLIHQQLGADSGTPTGARSVFTLTLQRFRCTMIVKDYATNELL